MPALSFTLPGFKMPGLMPAVLTSVLGLVGLGSANTAAADAFVDQLAVTNAAEIQAAQVALQTTTFDDTRNLAKRMVEDHTDLATQLTALAAQLSITLPDDAVVQAKAAKLQAPAVKGAGFDAAYATAQIHAHEAAVALFDNEARTATVPELKAFAAANLPLMKHHLQMATRLLRTHRK